MDKVLSVLMYIVDNYQAIAGYLVAVFAGLTGLFLMIPGDQPEKFFKGVAGFLEKFSKK